jgi:hypothetical protein
MTDPFDISLSIPFTGKYDLDVKYVILGFDAEEEGNLISATSSDLNTGDFILKVEEGTTIKRIEVRTVLDELLDELTGTWPAEVPENRTVNNVTLGEGDLECYDATNSITVTNTVIGENAVAEFRAGFNIIFGEGFVAEAGSNVHAFITTVFCQPEPMLASKQDVISREILPSAPQESLFKVYPNPTAGSFTLELTEKDDATAVTIEIYNLMGERLLHQEFSGASLYQVDMSAMPRGMYIVRALNGESMEVQRIIKQ